MKVTLISHTENAEQVVAAAARLCYSNASDIDTLMNNLTPEKTEKFVERLISMGHESPFEHVNFVFGIEGVSRTLSHQLVRHRHSHYSQQSQRYCSMGQFEYVMPPSVKAKPDAVKTFEDIMRRDQEAYDKLIELGVPKEDARFVLPNACTTRLIYSANLREIWNTANLRCCARAQWEIRAMYKLILEEARKVAPLLFKHAGATCVAKGYCPEGDKSCGRAPTMEALLDAYKNKTA